MLQKQSRSNLDPTDVCVQDRKSRGTSDPSHVQNQTRFHKDVLWVEIIIIKKKSPGWAKASVKACSKSEIKPQINGPACLSVPLSLCRCCSSKQPSQVSCLDFGYPCVFSVLHTLARKSIWAGLQWLNSFIPKIKKKSLLRAILVKPELLAVMSGGCYRFFFCFKDFLLFRIISYSLSMPSWSPSPIIAQAGWMW